MRAADGDSTLAPLRALIVDDEPPARARIRRILEAESGIEIVGECANGPEALAAIERAAPHLVFLDVQMPVMDGFEVLRSIDGPNAPAVIFVTAYDEYALRAFEVHALDYLLKPFNRDRFHDALARARTHLVRGVATGLDPRLVALLDHMAQHRAPAQRLVVRSEGRIVFIRLADLDWVEAAANYVRLHARGETYLLRRSMKQMERQLPGDSFLRIHRSTIVNIDRIKELQPWFHGEYVAILHDGTKLTVSRAYADRIQQLIG